jgi:hypothetical protein
MRFTSFVQHEFVPCMADDLARARVVLEHYRGPWEVWAQVEAALRVSSRPEYTNYVFEREVRYPDSPLACDFRINPHNAEGNYIWIELKVELHTGFAELARRFVGDVDKLSKLNDGRFGENTGGAIAFATAGAQTFITELQMQIERTSWRHFSLWLFSPNKPPARVTLDAPGTSFNSWAAVAYCSVLKD